MGDPHRAEEDLTDGDERVAFLDGGADLDFDGGDFAGAGCEDEGVHFHGLEGDEVVAFIDLLTGLYDDGGDSACERRRDIARSAGCGGSGRLNRGGSGRRYRGGWRCRGRQRGGECRGWSRRRSGIVGYLDGYVVGIAVNGYAESFDHADG